MKTNEAPVVVEATYPATRDDVWAAITEVNRMQEWYFENIPEFRPEVGFETVFEVECGDRTFPHRWTVTEVDPGESITYRWRYDGFPGDSFVTFALSGEGDGITLRLSTRVVEDFPDEIPEFARESCLAGWNYFLRERLPAYLASAG